MGTLMSVHGNGRRPDYGKMGNFTKPPSMPHHPSVGDIECEKGC